MQSSSFDEVVRPSLSGKPRRPEMPALEVWRLPLALRERSGLPAGWSWRDPLLRALIRQWSYRREPSKEEQASLKESDPFRH
jgi:hypothetical protein